ncbi:hypothetical protein NPIL_117111 [Nephila pilipes]|uniref:Uncharacterized protein n=1 Tax=Nephila pilipes TaxID=299642 RepID=A0A8X6MK91_NEPPI|nr:hypothetical protein NPIL_117111 [Nephila pilipes]
MHEGANITTRTTYEVPVMLQSYGTQVCPAECEAWFCDIFFYLSGIVRTRALSLSLNTSINFKIPQNKNRLSLTAHHMLSRDCLLPAHRTPVPSGAHQLKYGNTSMTFFQPLYIEYE